MAKKKGIKFVTQKERKAHKVRQFILAFVAFLLAFAFVSLAYIFKAYHISFSDFIKEQEQTSKVSQTDVLDRAELLGKANFILAATDNKERNIYFLFAVCADLDNKEVRVLPVNPASRCKVAGVEDTITNHLRRDSKRGLIDAVNSFTGIKADRFAIANEAQFKGAINALGGAQLNIKKRVDYKSKSMHLSLMPGEQSVKGETLLKYFRYVGMKEGISHQGQLMCEIISQFISDTYLSSGRGYFSEIINNINSDITIVDYSRSEKLLNAMADEKSNIQYKVVSSAASLKASNSDKNK